MNEIKNYAPLVLFVYNRADHVKQCLDAINENYLIDNTEFYIFSDGPKDNNDCDRVNEVRTVLREFENHNGFKEVHITEAKTNKGLAASVISGVTSVIEEYGKVIVIEDDLITSKDFLKFMNEGLGYYQDDAKIWSVAGYTPSLKCLQNTNVDVWFSDRAESWGWATWIDRWNSIDWAVSDYDSFRSSPTRVKRFKKCGYNLPELLDKQMNGQIDSWAIRFCYEQFKQNKYTVIPTKSRVLNIGFDGTGTHKEVHKKWTVDLSEVDGDVTFIPYRKNRKISREYYYFFAQYPHVRVARQIWKSLKEVLGIKKELNIFD